MNPILFRMVLLFTLPAEDMPALEQQAEIYNITVEHMLELYVAEKLDIHPTYVFAEQGNDRGEDDGNIYQRPEECNESTK
jgi:hypothetical protein